MYLEQESFLFFPKKLSTSYKFNYNQKFEELSIETRDKIKLNGLLFKADSSKGVVFYLHGNGGALDTWGNISSVYTDAGYDIFILDYRGYGKSEGEISGEEQFFSDVQAAYDAIKSRYSENRIIVIGYSVGTGPAARIASANRPKLLILQAPYYSLTDMMHQTYPFLPDFLLKYKFETHEFLKNTKSPVYIFHGTVDEVIYYGSSEKLSSLLKPGDKFFTLPGQGHNGINENTSYLSELRKLLNAP